MTNKENMCVTYAKKLALAIEEFMPITEFSARSGVSRSLIYKMKDSVHSRQSMETVERIATALGCDARAFIYDGDDSPELLRMSEQEFTLWSSAYDAPKFHCEIYDNVGDLLLERHFSMVPSEQEDQYLMIQSGVIHGSLQLIDQTSSLRDAAGVVLLLKNTNLRDARLPTCITSMGPLKAGRITSTAFDPTFQSVAAYSFFASISEN